MSRFAVLDVWAHVDPKFGGVGPAAGSLITAMDRSEVRGYQVAICNPEETCLADGIPPDVERVVPAGPRLVNDLSLRISLRALVEQSDICHVHGLWLPHTLAARNAAFRMHKPIVSSVHGMLERWELANKSLKKKMYSSLFERKSLARSACLRALTFQEAEDYRRYGLQNPIAVVPNGIAPLQRQSAALLWERYPKLAGKSIVLFLSRVHYKKGILQLLEAWQQVAAARDDAHLLVAGPDCEGTLDRAERIVAERGLSNSVTFCGTLSGELKTSALSAARFLCLPSYSEGLSVAVLEALSLGLPVIATPACHMPDIALQGAGIVTSNRPSTLAGNLLTCLNLSAGEWQSMSDRAATLARQRYDWSGIAEKMRSVYVWLLGGPKPACVLD